MALPVYGHVPEGNHMTMVTINKKIYSNYIKHEMGRNKKTKTKNKKNYAKKKTHSSLAKRTYAYRRLPLGGFPKTKVVRLRYAQIDTFNPAAGSYAVNAYRANSIHDPDSTGAGHQPSNHDVWAGTYEKYCVMASFIKVTPVQTSLTGVIPGMLCLALSSGGTDIATCHGFGGIQSILEQPRLLEGKAEVGNLNQPLGDICLKSSFDLRQWFRLGHTVNFNPYNVDFGATPIEGVFYEVAFVSPDDNNDPGSFKFRVEIDYIVLCSEPFYTDYS